MNVSRITRMKLNLIWQFWLDAALRNVAQYFIAVNALPIMLVTRFRRICIILHILFSPVCALEFLPLADGGPNVLAHGASHEITRHKACLHRHADKGNGE